MDEFTDDEIKCNYIKCSAGMGLAGGNCYLNGNPKNPHCPKFEDEEKMLKEWEEKSNG